MTMDHATWCVDQALVKRPPSHVPKISQIGSDCRDKPQRHGPTEGAELEIGGAASPPTGTPPASSRGCAVSWPLLALVPMHSSGQIALTELLPTSATVDLEL